MLAPVVPLDVSAVAEALPALETGMGRDRVEQPDPARMLGIPARLQAWSRIGVEHDIHGQAEVVRRLARRRRPRSPSLILRIERGLLLERAIAVGHHPGER